MNNKPSRESLLREKIQGCLLGGALGDALGWPIEFMKRRDITNRFGEGLFLRWLPGRAGLVEVTDDTQMTLFTAEGLLCALVEKHKRGIFDPVAAVHNAYLQWLYTQGESCPSKHRHQRASGWLSKNRSLYAVRAPGNTCISALRSGEIGTIENPINDSKGCGGVMRVAPVGCLLAINEPFEWGARLAAITHGHPSGYLSAGVLSHMIRSLLAGKDPLTAWHEAREELLRWNGHKETLTLMDRAAQIKDQYHSFESSINDIEDLGQGWTGEEALAMSFYALLKGNGDPALTLGIAVTHNGDSDSTGAIAGNLLGAWKGLAVFPEIWLEKLELRDVITQMADDLFIGYKEDEKWEERYPWS